MELRLLQYFLMVAQEENITKAAELLPLTQPTLSRQLAQLEKELGEKLFVRGRHFHLTETGVILRHQALEIVSMMDKLENDIHHHGEVAGLKCVQFLMRCMTEFQQEYPEVTFDLQNSNAVDIKEQLEHGTLDLGVMMEPVDTSSFDYIRMKDFYILDQSKMDLASPEMLVLHPLPRVNEISVDVDNDPRAAYFKQVQYGVYARMALILTLLNIKVD